MTTDHLEVLFADLRADTLPTVQPPGTVAVRQTVRRRRTGRAVLSAAAAVLVIAGGIAVSTGHRSAAPPADATPSVTPSAIPSVAEDPLLKQANVARQALLAGQNGTPAIDAAEPVVGGYRVEHGKYPGKLLLRVACAGSGHFTLTVDAHDPKVEWKKIAQVPVECSDQPVPASTTFTMVASSTIHRMRLADAMDSSGNGGFAYQVTSATGAPLSGEPEPTDSYNPDRRLKLDGREPETEGTARLGRGRPQAGMAPSREEGRYLLLTKCTGTGIATLAVRSGGKDIVTVDTVCASPAGPQTETPGIPVDMMTSVSIRADGADGLLSWALIPS
ncbi:hypothetical protein [Actinoplanes derwentensis]|uniref:hypothetical protein n=1 Tax=Actinoplanes derwentensis TaxID=113562 RepID=UPI000B89A9F2|nr:hypothetical protein [Actinoplanes derwentensis]